MKYTELNDCEEFYHKVEYYNKTKTEQLSYHYKEILKLLGEDPDREGLVKTQLVKLRFVQHAPGKFEPLVRQHFSTPFEQKKSPSQR